MTIFGPINDLFSSKEDRTKLLESRNIQLARLDAFSSTESNFNTSVAQAKQSIQEKKNDNILANHTPQPLPNPTTSPTVTPQPLAGTTTEPSTTTTTTSATTTPTTPTSATTTSATPTSATPGLAATENTQQPLSSKEEERIRTVAENLNTPSPAQNTSATLTTEEPSTLSQILDVVNPLQHIPFINLAYREVTGDTITPASKIIGGTLFGGLLGGVGAIAGAGAAVGFTSGVADASFTKATGIETSSATAKLYRGESFNAQDKNTFTASSKNTASDAIASDAKAPSENKKSFTPTFDARHVYADVLRKFGTDIDVLLAHNPDSYGAQVVYSNAIAHVDSLSSQQLVAHKPQETTTTQEQLAFLHSRIPSATSATTANTTNTQNTQPVASLYSTSSPLVIKDEALQRLAIVRQNLNIPPNQTTTATAASDTPASPAPSHDITSLIERRLTQLINAKENGAIPSLFTANTPTPNTPAPNTPAPNTPVASSSELPLNTLPQNTNLASLNPTPQATPTPALTPAVQQDPVADVMKQRLEQFNARREQQINNGAAEHVVSTPLPAITSENVVPQKVSQAPASQAPASEAVAQEKNSLQPERLASAMRDAFSRLGRGLVARN